MSELISHNPWTGISAYHDYDDSSKKTYITYKQDVEPILNRNKQLQNDTSYKAKGIKEDFYHIGSIPMNVALEWETKHGVDLINRPTKETMDKAIKLLQDPEYKYLRTTGKI